MSHLRCPAECAHNSFSPSNVGLFGKIESRLLDRMEQRLQEKLGDLGDSDLAERLEFESRGGAMAVHAIYMETLIARRTVEGKTLLELWQADGWSGLKNDEAVLTQSFMSMRPALMEVQCVRDERTMAVMDLLDESPTIFHVVDADWALQARRFGVFLGWRYEAPFFSRISGPTVIVPWCGLLQPLEVLRAIVTHLDGPSDPGAMREWLWSNLVRVAEVVNALHEVRVMTDEWSDRKRRRMEQLVPPCLLESLEASEEAVLTLEAWKAKYASFADQEQVALGMRTPRQAAAEPARRVQLMGLMKQQVMLTDETRYQTKLDVDLKDLLLELGLPELVLPAPPLPVVSEEEAAAMIGEADGEPTLITQMLDAVSLRGMPKHFRQPPPKQVTLHLDDVEARLAAFAIANETRDSAVAWFARTWPGLAEGIDAMTEDTLDDVTYSVVQLQVARAAGILHPTPPARADGSPQRMAWNLGADMERLASMCEDDDSDEVISTWLTTSVQPAVSQRLCAETHVIMEDLGISDSMERRFAVTALIKAAITEMCYWPVRE